MQECSTDFTPVSAPILRKLAPFLEEEKETIVDMWRGRDSTVELFEKFKIDSGYFKTTFGIPVVSYFIGVIKGTKKVGDCPVMHAFMDYMVNRDVTAKDIFILCMALRRSLIKHLLLNHQMDLYVTNTLEEISNVFDANLAGVLETFSDIIREKEQQLQQQKTINKQQKYIQTILNAQQNLICVVRNAGIVIANRPFLHTLGVKNISELRNIYGERWDFIQEVKTGADLFAGQEYGEWIEAIIRDGDGAVKVTLPCNRPQKRCIYIAQANRLNVEPPEYILSFTDISAYEEQFKRLKSQLYTDPLTKLPNRLKFDEVLMQRAEHASHGSKPLAMITVAIDRFHALEKKYDEHTVDSIIKKIADYLSQENSKHYFYAHIHTNEFAFLCDQSAVTPRIAFAQRLKEGVTRLGDVLEDDITCSIAIVLFREDDTLEHFLQRSEFLLDEIEELGGNLVKDDHSLYHEHKVLEKNSDRIIGLLEDIFKTDKEIKGTGYYKEIPITSALLITKVNTKLKTIQVKVLNEKLFASFSPQIILSCEGVPKFIKSNVKASYPSEQRIELGNFEYSDSALTQRKNVRIEPHKHIPIIILREKEQLTGTLINLSINSIMFEIDDIGPLKTGDEVNVNFILSEENADNTLHCDGRILSIQKRTRYHIVVILHLDARNEDQISSYISWRQMQIIKELRYISFSEFMPVI